MVLFQKDLSTASMAKRSMALTFVMKGPGFGTALGHIAFAQISNFAENNPLLNHLLLKHPKPVRRRKTNENIGGGS